MRVCHLASAIHPHLTESPNPMLSKTLEAALNKQIGHEFTAAYNYLAMAAWFEFEDWTGFAQWMYVQREEELTHAMKIFKFVCDRGGLATLPALAKPPGEYKNPHDVFAHAFQMEKATSKCINDLYAPGHRRKKTT